MTFNDREYEEETICCFAELQMLMGKPVPKRIAISPVAFWKIARRLGSRVVDDCMELVMVIGRPVIVSRATLVSDADCPDDQFHDLENPRAEKSE